MKAPHARLVAKHLGTDHHERTFSAEAVQELLPDVASWLDEPFGDASILPTHLLSRFARTEVTVAARRRWRRRGCSPAIPPSRPNVPPCLFRRLPRAARALAGAAVGRLPVKHGNFSLDFQLKQFLSEGFRIGPSRPSAAGSARTPGPRSSDCSSQALFDRRRSGTLASVPVASSPPPIH